MESYGFEIYINEIRLKEGVKEFIELLKKQNMKLGIATSNSRKLAKDCLRSNGILDAFDYICTSDEVPKVSRNRMFICMQQR